MDFYFSGIASKSEVEMLRLAGVKRVLVDPVQFPLVAGSGFDLALDSGAYRASKGTAWYREDYQAFLYKHGSLATFDFLTSFDVIGNARQSLENYDHLKSQGFEVVPVWHWGEDSFYLDVYVDESEVVGIGGLVHHMREKDEQALEQLYVLCCNYPNRFHLFGLAWPKAIEVLNDVARSADSSVWLRGARYGYAIFEHEGHGHLTQAPARFIPKYKGLNREQRCAMNARNIQTFCEGE